MKGSWKVYMLEELGNHYGGLTNKTKEDFGTGKPYIPYLNIFENGRINPENLDLVKILPSERQNRVKYGDLFFTTSSETPHEVGMTSVLLDDIGEAYLNSFCFGFRLNNFDDLLPEYASYLFRGKDVRKLISDLAQGSTRYNLSKSIFFEKLKFNLPPLPQQRKIAKILSTFDEVIEKTKDAIAKYQSIKQGMMHDLFTRGIDIKTGKLRPKQEEAPELYQESDLGWIPKEWVVKKLEELTSLVTDGAHFSPTPQEKGLPIGNVKDMRNSTFNYEDCTNILPEVFELLVRQNCSPRNGDVLLSKDGTVGKVIHFKDPNKIVLLSSIAILRVNNLISSNYLAWILRSEYFDKALFGLLSGSALKRITLKDINKIRVPYSKVIEEQEAIAKRLDLIDSKIDLEQITLNKHKKIKSGLMQDLLSGNKMVTV